jgi:hypothetical protein
MARSLLAFGFVAALLASGCVPVTESVGDTEKAEPDKALVGKWAVTSGRGLASQLEIRSLAIDALDVKGNPKGLLRAVMKQKDETEMWFFPATIGKRTYANVVITKDGNNWQKFDKEGDFAEWKKEPNKRFFVFQYARDGEALTLDCGNNETFAAIMKEAKIENDGAKHLSYYKTPVGWLAKYLDKTGPAKVFDGTNTLALARDGK